MTEERLLSQALTAIRRSLPIHMWGPFADAIVSDRRLRQANLAKPEPDHRWLGELANLHNKGYARLPTTLPIAQIAEIRKYFDANPVHKGPHVYSFDGRPKRIAEAQSDFSLSLIHI